MSSRTSPEYQPVFCAYTYKFFLQAEDGIRDGHVTGVQTCALPILKEGLDIVRTSRNRYDGRIRNPFNEYECGHWYARALSSYGYLQAITGARYDAVDKTLYIDSK